jgi:hypothetical protein
MSPRYGISPYFAVIKPTIEMGFDYKKLNWLRRQFHPEVMVSSIVMSSPVPKDRESLPKSAQTDAVPLLRHQNGCMIAQWAVGELTRWYPTSSRSRHLENNLRCRRVHLPSRPALLKTLRGTSCRAICQLQLNT